MSLNRGIRASLAAQMVKNLPAVQGTWVPPLGWKDPLEKGVTTHSNILAWRIPWTEEPGELPSMGPQRVRHNWVTNPFTFYIQIKCKWSDELPAFLAGFSHKLHYYNQYDTRVQVVGAFLLYPLSNPAL